MLEIHKCDAHMQNTALTQLLASCHHSPSVCLERWAVHPGTRAIRFRPKDDTLECAYASYAAILDRQRGLCTARQHAPTVHVRKLGKTDNFNQAGPAQPRHAWRWLHK